MEEGEGKEGEGERRERETVGNYLSVHWFYQLMLKNTRQIIIQVHDPSVSMVMYYVY